MNDLQLQIELIKKIVKTKVQGVPMLVAGGAAIDTALGRCCNDIDIFIPRSIVDTVGLQIYTLLETWCVQLDTFEGSSIRILESEYGDSTLVYEVLGSYKTSPVKLQFIAVESYNIKGDAIRFPNFITSVLSSFGVTTSKVACFESTLGLLAFGSHTSGLRVSNQELQIAGILYTEGSEKLLAKSVEKYLQYSQGGFKRVVKGSGSFRSTDYRCFLMREDGTLVHTSESVHKLLEESYVVKGTKTFDHFGDKDEAAGDTEESVSNLRSNINTFFSSIRSRPQIGTGESSVAQELQPARGEVRWVNTPSSFPDSFRTDLRELNAVVEYGEAPPVLAPRPSNNF
jgi:hypothetical protein